MAGTVNVRELRQNLSAYLRRVKAGESLRVLERGAAVAVLTPLPENLSAVERLTAERRLIRARLDLDQIGDPPAVASALSMTEALEEQREELSGAG